jgi:hypothetical protein
MEPSTGSQISGVFSEILKAAISNFLICMISSRIYIAEGRGDGPRAPVFLII